MKVPVADKKMVISLQINNTIKMQKSHPDDNKEVTGGA